MTMKQIPAAKFKASGLALLDEVGPEGIVITKHGKPVARLVPYDADSRSLSGALAGTLKITGDVESTGEAWDAES